jgi:5-methylthioadenosine/S-adenosylhomocysteine deaminase
MVMTIATTGSTSGARPARTILTGGDVVTMNAARDVLVGGAIVIDGDRIAAVGGTAALRAEYADAVVVDVTGDVITPGLIDAHQHLTGDPLIRCCIPDRIDARTAIEEWAVPIHQVHGADDDELAATLAAVEAVTNGVTTVIEAGTVAHPADVAIALERVGIRAGIGPWGWDAEGAPFAGPVDEVIDRQRDVLDDHPPGGLVEGWVTLVGHDLCSDGLVVAAAALARERGAQMTMHMSPHSGDATSFLDRTGRRPIEHLAQLGVLGPHLLIGHGVSLDDREVDLVLEHDVSIAACPWAYLRLGQGVTRAGRHAEIVRRGGRVALGCDSGNAGDTIDVLRAAALFAGLARDTAVDPLSFGAHQAFELATIEGARAIGMADRIGSIEVGKQADLVVHRTDVPGWTPRGDVGVQLVWGTDGRSVRDVWVAGRRVVAGGTPTGVDTDQLADAAMRRRTDLLQRAGIDVAGPWPHRDAR